MKKYLIVLFICSLFFLNSIDFNFRKKIVYEKIIKNSRVIDLVFEYSREYSIQPELVLSVMAIESGFNPKAISRNWTGTGYSRGLMQLNDQVFTKMTKKEFYDVETNIKTGIKHLSLCLEKSNGNILVALAYYNAGRNRVKYYGVPEVTLYYMGKILNYKKFLENAYERTF